MPVLRPAASDYTTVVKSLANAGGAVTNPQGFRPPSKVGVAFVNGSRLAALIRGLTRLVATPPVNPSGPRLLSVLPVDPNNYTTYQNTNFLTIEFISNYFARDISGNVYGRLLDAKYYKIAPNGTQTFLAGDGDGDYGVFSPGLGAAAKIGAVTKQLVFDSLGNLFTAYSNLYRIIKIEPTGNVTFFAGTGEFGYNDGPAATASFGTLNAIAIDPLDTLYVSERSRTTIRKITSSGQVSTLTYSAAFGPQFSSIAVDAMGIIYAIEPYLHNVYKITPTGPTTADIALLAGGSTTGYVNEQGSAARFNFSIDSGICVDAYGNVYVGDTNNGSVRKISPSGNVITIAGNGTPAIDSATQLFYSYTPIIDANGELYVTTLTSVRKLSPIVPIVPLAIAGGTDIFVVKYDSAGTPQWARRIGGLASDQAGLVSTDSSGNIVVAGGYSSNPLTIFAANGTMAFTLANAGSFDTFVVKYDSVGTPLWARRIGGGGDDFISRITTDSSGNIVVVGQYDSSSLTIYNENGTTAFTLTNLGGIDAVVVKYDSAGTPQFARRIGGSSADRLWSISSDSSGNIVVVGQYDSSSLTIFAADGNPSFTTLTNSGSNDVFIVKYDSTGTPLWARRLGGTGDDQVRSVSIDLSGNIVVAGQYASSPLTIFAADGTMAFTLANAGLSDAFVVKYNSAGTPQWARRVGGTSADFANSVSTDSSGNIVVAGYYVSTTLTIYNENGTTAFTLANDSENSFVVKYNSEGTPQWVRRVGIVGAVRANSVTSTDSSGNIVVAGFCTANSVIIYNANGTTAFTLANGANQDGFVVKYNSEGTPQWAKRVGGPNNDYITAVTTDSTGNIVIYGQYASNPLTIT